VGEGGSGNGAGRRKTTLGLSLQNIREEEGAKKLSSLRVTFSSQKG